MASILRTQLPTAVREIRFQFSPSSKPMIEFIKTAYPPIKAANPTLPFLIRPATHTPSRAFIRFERGLETRVDLDTLESVQSIEDSLSSLIKAATS
ncbi:hypothetical protein CROQUDRAFT_98914 [Cronartium quercuum f. sp. fusiforme G11]|uniref:Ribosomal protein/NADH dehydrogenase domain-containing protein n=1 Tax=Cronartium quercuum f. sp. fusiforme G11 TaxID=708437 RepID=A0A9P6N7Z8_9BASI|nr:hypothetical protein CROQUDRAFT_98914 [Cronartium quercuum f. sp. fusiforme G11]